MMSRTITILSTIAGVAVITSPAFASKVHKKKTPRPQPQVAQDHRAFGPNAIYGWDGRYRGWDPDPNIRFQLMRDLNEPND